MTAERIEIRQAAREDIEILVRMRIALLREVGNLRNEAEEKRLIDAIRRHFETELLAERYAGLIARVKTEAVACGGLTFYVRPPYEGNISGEEAYLMGMYTVESWRGKGIGSAILKRLIELARARGVGGIWLHSEPGARTLYGREGFRPNDMYMELTW